MAQVTHDMEVASDVRVALLDLTVYAVMIAACVAFFFEGGVLGLMGAAAGAAAGVLRSRGEGLNERIGSGLSLSLAGLWAGVMIGAMCAGLLAAVW